MALDYTYAGAGYFAAGIVYIFSMVTAIAGIPLQGSSTDMAGTDPWLYPLRSYAVLTLPPLFLLTVLYLFGVGWHKKRESEQQRKEHSDGKKEEEQ